MPGRQTLRLPVVLSDDTETIDGKRKQLRRGGYRIKSEAQDALAEAHRRIAGGEKLGETVRVGDYLASWLEAKQSAGRKPATISQYRDLVGRYLVPHLGKVKLTDLRAAHVEKMLAAMEGEGRGLVTRRRTTAVLSSALGSAVKRRLVPWNVCTQIELASESSEPRPVSGCRRSAYLPCRRQGGSSGGALTPSSAWSDCAGAKGWAWPGTRLISTAGFSASIGVSVRSPASCHGEHRSRPRVGGAISLGPRHGHGPADPLGPAGQEETCARRGGLPAKDWYSLRRWPAAMAGNRIRPLPRPGRAVRPSENQTPRSAPFSGQPRLGGWR